MRIRLTIKRMLNVLVVSGVAVVCALAAASFVLNYRMAQGQQYLITVSLPLANTSHEFAEAISALINREALLLGISNLTELQAAGNRVNVEQQLEHAYARINNVANAVPHLQNDIEALKQLYGQILQADQSLFNALQSRLQLEQSILEQASRLDKIAQQLQENAEAIMGRLNFLTFQSRVVLRHMLQASSSSVEWNRAIHGLLENDYAKPQRAAAQLRVAAGELSMNALSTLMVVNTDELNDLRGNKLAQALFLTRSAVAGLRLDLARFDAPRELLQNIEPQYEQLIHLLDESDDSLLSMAYRRLQQIEIIRHQQKDLNGHFHAVNQLLNKLQEQVIHTNRETAEQLTWERLIGEISIAAISLLAVLLMLTVSSLIRQRIVSALDNTMNFVDTLSRGDFTAQIHWRHQDEIALMVSKLRQMAEHLSSLLGQVQRSGIQVTSSATELAATAKEQEAIISHQEQSSQEVRDSVEKISTLAVHLEQTMQQVVEMVQQTADVAGRGQADLGRMQEAMQQMEQASASISTKLETINEKAENITSVVTTINKVADQTNLLSLNAAIEAEKAGEYGRGFTVVAREIRRLADQTAIATLDIDEMVKEMQNAVASGVMEMDRFIAEVRRSTEDVDRISGQLTQIIQRVQTLSPQFGNVNEAMISQAGHTRQIHNSMHNLREEMQQTAESLRESYAAIGQLNDAARGLQDEMARFKVGGRRE